MENLQGQVAILTGAADGLGRCIARAYSEAGLRLAMMDVQGDRLMRLASELTDQGADCLPIVVDLADATTK